MIRKITFENFCSLRDKGVFNLTTSLKTPTDHSFTPSCYGDQVSILGGVFGPNASGKTNLLKVFCFLNFFLQHSYRSLKAGELIPIDPFANSEAPLSFSLEFEGQDEIYRYDLRLTPKKVISERIRRFHKSTNSFRMILQRKEGANGPSVTQSENFTDVKILNELLKNRPNASMISAGSVTGRPEFESIARALGHIESNVNRSGKEDSHTANQFSQLIECARYFQENEHFLEEVELRLRQADLGISKLEIREIEMVNQDKGTTEKAPFPFAKHQTAEGEFMISLANESSGTKRLFTLLRSFLPVLTHGGIAVIDEMESDLHPHLIPLLLDLFTDQDTNPKRAQLIFTCHHVEVLNQLAKEQIFLVDKDDLNASTVKRLSDIKGVRRDENHFSNYNAGRYDAIPEPKFF